MINAQLCATATIGPRRHSRTRQRVCVIGTVFKKACYLSKKATKERNKKTKDQKIGNALQSDLATFVVGQGTGLLHEKIT